MNSFEWFDKITGFSEKKWNYQLDTLPAVITNNMGQFGIEVTYKGFDKIRTQEIKGNI